MSIVVNVVKMDFHVDGAAILALMLPLSRAALDERELFVHPPLEPFRVVGWSDVRRSHPQEFIPAVSVLLHCGIVDFEKLQGRDIEYIGRMGNGRK